MKKIRFAYKMYSTYRSVGAGGTAALAVTMLLTWKFPELKGKEDAMIGIFTVILTPIAAAIQNYLKHAIAEKKGQSETPSETPSPTT